MYTSVFKHTITFPLSKNYDFRLALTKDTLYSIAWHNKRYDHWGFSAHSSPRSRLFALLVWESRR